MKVEKIKINLGSGPDGVTGWVNYDWGWLPVLAKIGLLKILVRLGLLAKDYDRIWPDFKLVDVRKGLPLDNESVDFVYCSHVLEHFEKWQAMKVVAEIRRVLRVGGLARFVLPDIDKVVSIKDPDELCRVWWGYDKEKIRGIKSGMVREHRWMYSFKSFERLLTEVGFKKIRFLKYRQGQLPDLKKLDLAIHRNLSFYVEVEK